jgi:gluconolactonase
MEGNFRRRDLILGAIAVGVLKPSAECARDATDMTVAASGLHTPEGPVVLADGSVLVCEITAGRVSRISPDGGRETLAEMGGGPNGAAIGPDGALYVCNNGGFTFSSKSSEVTRAANYTGGRIERVDIKTGNVEVVYRSVDGNRLSAPNDLVFDDHGGFWFTDTGAASARSHDYGGLYYAKADGSLIKEVVYPLEQANGVALSPDGKVVYVALTYQRLILAFPITGDGNVERGSKFLPGRPVIAMPAGTLLDSMKVEADGTLCVGTLMGEHGILRVSSSGQRVGFIPCPDAATTNIAFGGRDMRTAFITQSIAGQLLRARWPAVGLKLNYQKS